MKLYTYWRSGTSYRARLALALKGIAVEQVAVNLLEGEHRGDEYGLVNPQHMVPTLELDDGTRLTQSPAIIEYLEERFPEPPLLPAGARGRARVRQLAAIIGCDIHPINNLRVLKYLKGPLGQPQSEIDDWIAHWITEGFHAFEALLEQDPARGEFCYGAKPTLAECYLLPQIYAARRFHVPLDTFPQILAVEQAMLAIDAVKGAVPEAQADATN